FSGREFRPSRLLVTEVQGLEALLGATPAGSLDRPKIMLRLGHEYAELGYRAQQDARAAQAAFEASGDVAKKNEAAKADQIRKMAFVMSAKAYAYLSKEQPQGCAALGGCADETTYFAALAMERGGGAEHARSAYLEVVRGRPESRWVPYAFIGLGEAYLDEGREDPANLDRAAQAAVQAFETVVKVATPEDGLMGYALLRLGQIFLHLNQPDAASAAFGKLTALAAKHPVSKPIQIAARLVPQQIAFSPEVVAAVKQTSDACDAGQAWACTTLAERVRDARGVRRDDAHAMALFEKGCGGGDVAGCRGLVGMVVMDRDAPEDAARRAALVTKACDAGVGCEVLADLVDHGRGVPVDDARAAALYTKGCEAGDTMSCDRLWARYAAGRGVAKDDARAAALYERACAAGHDRACIDLADMIDQGRAVGD